jgi:glycosyltransferase involved in cell wall biosynthesis
MRSKGIMIVPLQAGGGMRIKLIEGMALGKAIVATHVAAEGIPAKHGEHLLLCGNTDADAFVNALGSLIEKKELAEMLGRNAQQLAQQHFDSRLLTEKLFAFYETLFT